MGATPRHLRDRFKYFGPGTVVVLLSFVVAFLFVKPAPPRRLVIGSGQPEGAYYRYGLKYQEILARNGIELEVRVTGGSVENLRLLEAGDVDVAFVQGGVGGLTESDELVSLGSLYYEPIWFLVRSDLKLDRIQDLRGLRIDLGKPGSGTNVVSRQILDLVGVPPEDLVVSAFGGSGAADKLISGDLDAAFMIYGYQAPVIQRLLRSGTAVIWTARRSAAFARIYRHLTILTLPEGIVDLAENIPPRDTVVLAAAAQLAARSDFHPALIDLFLEAAEEIHGQGGVFEEPGEFPALKLLDFRTTKDIRRYYKTGPSFLRRYLPFWLATFIDRMKIMIVPLVAILFPFFKVMPPLYRWRVRSRIFRWYRQLEELDPSLQKGDITDRLPEYLARLEEIEASVSRTAVPLGYRDEVYNLRLHIDLLRSELINAAGGDSPSG